MIEIPGDHLEGGGAILRTATALSTVTGKPVHIFNIRKSRPNPGLQAQHLEGLKAVAGLCSARLEGAKLGSTEVWFHPGKIHAKEISVSIGTAGSIGLLFQTLALPASRASGPVTLKVQGGATFGKWAPPLPATQSILLPVLQKMGYHAHSVTERHGFYPAGGARVTIAVQPRPELKPLILENSGKTTHLGGLSVASSHLQTAKVAERQARAAEALLKEKGFSPLIKELYVEAECPGSGLVLWASDGKAILGADALGERGKRAEDVGREAGRSLLQAIHSCAGVDAHLSDQLLLFLACANGPSRITTPALTRHAETNIWVIQQFLPVTFRTVQEQGRVLIECSGSPV